MQYLILLLYAYSILIVIIKNIALKKHEAKIKFFSIIF